MAQIALVCFYQYFGTTCFKSSENAFSPTTLTSKNPTKTNKTILWLKGFTVKDVPLDPQKLSLEADPHFQVDG